MSGDGVVVVPRQLERTTVLSKVIRSFSSKAGLDNQAKRGSELNGIPNPTFDNIVIKRIANLKNLVLAYENIKSKPVNMSPGTDKTTLDGINIKDLAKRQKELKSGTYKFPPARRVEIPKPGKDEKRPLNIIGPREKVIQKGIQQVMEPEYEKIFIETSHGFRPGRGTHTAIQYIDAKFQSVRYIIEADFAKAFDSIQHYKLMEIIKRKCKCTKTLNLLKSALKAGYIEFGQLHENLEVGTPQGSVLSPLLCNIFLHELDMFIIKLKEEYEVGKNRKRNKEYESIANRLKYMRKQKIDVKKPSEYRDLKKALLGIPSRRFDETFIRIHYVRYADDFIIGVEGSMQITKEILKRVTNFIEGQLSLKLNESKTGITNFTKEPITFLGYKIMGPNIEGIAKAVEQIKAVNSDRIISRRKKIRIRIAMDYAKVLNKLLKEGYIRFRNSTTNHLTLTHRGTFQGSLINLEHADIINYYSSKIRGLYNYYNFVSNMSQLAFIC